MMGKHTLGSLFSGSGGFELAGSLAGIKPIFNSEIEPFCKLVTTKNFPDVKHYGDITILNGEELPPVDIITFGSPCQDMSIAGKREGLEGSRSRLFYEAIRIIKEMRKKTDGRYPRYIVWENVYGCLSSSSGEDFRKVLEEICRIKDRDVVVPRPETKWKHAGQIMGDDYSIAWRLLDAQFWGVPQRRRRVFLVADFGGQSAPEILFKSEGMQTDPRAGRLPWQRSSQNTEDGIGAASEWPDDRRYVINTQGSSGVHFTKDATGTLVAESHGNNPAILDKVEHKLEPTYAISREAYNSGKNADFNFSICKEVAPTIVTAGPCAISARRHAYNIGLRGYHETEVSTSLDVTTNHISRNQNTTCVVSADEEADNTLGGKDYKDLQDEQNTSFIVRRLTPLECARLQGFPDDWCDDLAILDPTGEDVAFWKESWKQWNGINNKRPKTENQVKLWLANPYNSRAVYSMWGNGIALPCAYFVLNGIMNMGYKDKQTNA